MQDIMAYWKKLRSDASKCEMIASLSDDQTKRHLFALLAEQFGALASEAERVITSKVAPPERIVSLRRRGE
jgi:hypothetical protein